MPGTARLSEAILDWQNIYFMNSWWLFACCWKALGVTSHLHYPKRLEYWFCTGLAFSTFRWQDKYDSDPGTTGRLAIAMSLKSMIPDGLVNLYNHLPAVLPMFSPSTFLSASSNSDFPMHLAWGPGVKNSNQHVWEPETCIGFIKPKVALDMRNEGNLHLDQCRRWFGQMV